MKSTLNKRGDAGDWTNFFGFFLILVVIGGSIVGAYFSFFSEEYNVKQEESEVLFLKFKNCFLENDVFQEGFDIETCGLNLGVLEDRHLVYAKGDEREFFVGVRDYITQCDLVDKSERFAKCKRDFVMKNGVEFEIIVGSNQETRRLASA